MDNLSGFLLPPFRHWQYVFFFCFRAYVLPDTSCIEDYSMMLAMSPFRSPACAVLQTMSTVRCLSTRLRVTVANYGDHWSFFVDSSCSLRVSAVVVAAAHRHTSLLSAPAAPWQKKNTQPRSSVSAPWPQTQKSSSVTVRLES